MNTDTLTTARELEAKGVDLVTKTDLALAAEAVGVLVAIDRLIPS